MGGLITRRSGQALINVMLIMGVLVGSTAAVLTYMAATRSDQAYQIGASGTLHESNTIASYLLRQLAIGQVITPFATPSTGSAGQGLTLIANPTSANICQTTLWTFTGSGGQCTTAGCTPAMTFTASSCDSTAVPTTPFQNLFYSGVVPCYNANVTRDMTQPCQNAVLSTTSLLGADVTTANAKLTISSEVVGELYQPTATRTLATATVGVTNEMVLPIGPVPYAPVPACTLTISSPGAPPGTPPDIVPLGTTVTVSMLPSLQNDPLLAAPAPFTTAPAPWVTGINLASYLMFSLTSPYSFSTSTVAYPFAPYTFPTTGTTGNTLVNEPTEFIGNVLGPGQLPAPFNLPLGLNATGNACTNASTPATGSATTCPQQCGIGLPLAATANCPTNYSTCFAKVDIQPSCTLAITDSLGNPVSQVTVGTNYTATATITVNPTHQNNANDADDITSVSWSWGGASTLTPGGTAVSVFKPTSPTQTTLTATMLVTNSTSGNKWTGTCGAKVSYPRPEVLTFQAVDLGSANPVFSSGGNSSGASINNAYYDDNVQLKWTTSNVETCTLDAHIYNVKSSTSLGGVTICNRNAGDTMRPSSILGTYPIALAPNNLGNNGTAGTINLSAGSDTIYNGPSCSNPYTETYNDVYYYLTCTGNGQVASNAAYPNPGLSVSRWCYGAGGAHPSYFNASEAEAFECCNAIARTAKNGVAAPLNCGPSDAAAAAWGVMRCQGGMPFSTSGNLNYYGPYSSFPWCVCYDPLKVFGYSPYSFQGGGPNWSFGSSPPFVNPCGSFSSLGVSLRPSAPPND
jgi:hypothetical protein